MGGLAEAPAHQLTQTAGQLVPGLLRGLLCGPGATRCPLISLVCDCGPTASLEDGLRAHQCTCLALEESMLSFLRSVKCMHCKLLPIRSAALATKELCCGPAG